MGIYERIKSLCKSHGTTVKALEEELGFARSSLCKIDTNTPSAERLKKIADFFGVSQDYILTGTAGYYQDDETALLAQRLLTDPDLRALMDAAQDSSPEDIRTVADILRRVKGSNDG